MCSPQGRGHIRSRFLSFLSMTLILLNLSLLYQTYQLKEHVRGIPWHPSPKRVFDLLERSRSWKDVHGASSFGDESRPRYVLLLIFEPTDCSPCLEDLSVLNELHRQVSPEHVKIIGIASHTHLQELRKMIDAYGVTFPVLIDETSIAKALLGLAETPWKILVDLESRRIIFDMGPSLSEVERHFFLMRIMRLVRG
jgi:peroxiredoxin